MRDIDAAREKHMWEVYDQLRSFVQGWALDSEDVVRFSDLVSRPSKTHMYGFNNLGLVGADRAWASPTVWLATIGDRASYDENQERRCLAEVQGAKHVEDGWR